MRSWLSLILACILGGFFILVGQSKLITDITPDFSAQMRQQSAGWYRVLQPHIPIPFNKDRQILFKRYNESIVYYAIRINRYRYIAS